MRVNWWPWNSGGNVVVNNNFPDSNYYSGGGCCGGGGFGFGCGMPPIFATMMKFQMIQQLFNMTMNNIFPNRQQQQVPGYMQTMYPGLYLQQPMYDGRGGAASDEQTDSIKMQQVLSGTYKNIQTLSDGTVLAKDAKGNLIKASSMSELFEMAQEAQEAAKEKAKAEEAEEEEVVSSKKKETAAAEEAGDEVVAPDGADGNERVGNGNGKGNGNGNGSGSVGKISFKNYKLKEGYAWTKFSALPKDVQEKIKKGMALTDLCKALGLNPENTKNIEYLKAVNPNGIKGDKVENTDKLDVIYKATVASNTNKKGRIKDNIDVNGTKYSQGIKFANGNMIYKNQEGSWSNFDRDAVFLIDGNKYKIHKYNQNGLKVSGEEKDYGDITGTNSAFKDDKLMRVENGYVHFNNIPKNNYQYKFAGSGALKDYVIYVEKGITKIKSPDGKKSYNLEDVMNGTKKFN